MKQQDRTLNGKHFKRHQATADTQRKVADWDIWTCDDPTFAHDYDRTVSLLVNAGKAILTFADGETADLQAGDFMTIYQGATATWTISEALRNSYCYHDSFDSATKRQQLVYWQNNDTNSTTK